MVVDPKMKRSHDRKNWKGARMEEIPGTRCKLNFLPHFSVRRDAVTPRLEREEDLKFEASGGKKETENHITSPLTFNIKD